MTARFLTQRCWCLVIVFGCLFNYPQIGFAQTKRFVLRGDETPRKYPDAPSLVADNGLAHLVVGVKNLDESLKLWVDALGFELVARQKGPDAGLAKLWEMKADEIQDQAVIGTLGIRTGRLHLVQFAHPLPAVRDNAQPTDLLPKNIDIACKDMPVRYDELLKSGQKFRSKFVSYPVKDHPGEPLQVNEVQMFGTDGTSIMLIEIMQVSYPFSPKGFAGMTNFVPIVEDAAVEEKFYADVFGFPALTSHLLQGEEIEKMVGLPKGAQLDIRILGVEENYFGRIEMVDYKGVASVNKYPQAKPGALGVTHGTFFTSNIAEVKKRAEQAKARMIDHGTIKTIFGTAPALTVFTPAGLRLDVFARSIVTSEIAR